MRVAICLLVLLVLVGEAKAYSMRTAAELNQSTEGWESRKDFPIIKGRLDRLKLLIDEICRKQGVDPRAICGLIMIESEGKADAVDGIFARGKASESHVGLGQLSVSKLPQGERNNPRRAMYARMWQKTHQRIYLSKWSRLDSRFDPRWNLEQTITSFANNQRKCGDETLAIMAHHGGTNDPIRRVIKYAWDHDRKRIQASEVPSYVRNKGLNYFVLYEDKAPGHRYWAMKKEGHPSYALKVFAASKAAGFTLPVARPESIALEGAKMHQIQSGSFVGLVQASLHQLSSLGTDWATTGLHFLLLSVYMVLIAGAALVVLVGIRHSVPLLYLGAQELLRKLFAALPQVLKGLGSLYKVLFGTQKQRTQVLGRKAAAAGQRAGR